MDNQSNQIKLAVGTAVAALTGYLIYKATASGDKSQTPDVKEPEPEIQPPKEEKIEAEEEQKIEPEVE